MHTWTRSVRFSWQEPPYTTLRLETPQDAVDMVRATCRCCQRELHGPFSAAGDAVLLEPAIQSQLQRAVAAGAEMAKRSGGWFEARIAAYLTGHEWVDGCRVRRSSVADQTELLGPVMDTAATVRSELCQLVLVVQSALEPWPGMGQSCMTRESLANINDVILAYDAAAAEHYRIFAAYRAARTAELQHAWQTVPTEPDIPTFGERRRALERGASHD